MTTSQKNCFMAVASLRSYTKASKQLHISQPAVTKQIQILERELRLTLLERDKRTVQLTENGMEFYKLIQRHELELNQFLNAARIREQSFCGTVRVGLPSGWSVHQLHDTMLSDFERKYPNMKIMVVIHYFADLYRLLVEDEVDVILTLQPMVPLDQQINFRGVGSVKHAAAVSNTHPLSGKENLSIRDLAEETFYLTKDDEAGWMYWRNNILSNYGFEPMLSVAVNYLTQLAYIRNGKGVALIDMNCGMETKDDFRMIPLDFEEKICLVWKVENVSTETQLVIDWMSDYLKKNNGL